jgi:hypothetical protein
MPPPFKRGQIFDDIGSSGLRAFSGYVREEILPQLLGREAQRVYREMLDNSSVVGSIIFAITQAMRRVTWRVVPPNDSADAKELAEFVESMMEDMSHTWDDFVSESLSMLGYGFSVHELVYKRRQGSVWSQTVASSKYNDGRIAWRRLPGRGQDTIIKWFFDENGNANGLTQQPYIGPIIDLPIEKLLLFRSSSVKNNPEGRSILRPAYRAYYFIKRLEELEAISVERMNGFPVISVPSELIERALSVGVNGAPGDPQAAQAYAAYKKMAINIRVDEQMGAILPSDVWKAEDGKPSTARMFDLKFLTPEHAGTAKADTDKIITRYKVDILMTVLADFIQMGHEVRGTNNLAVTKVDMFYQAIEGWLNNHAAVLNRYALPRLWRLNGLNPDLMPQFEPDMAQRLDLDSLGAYIGNLAAAGMPMFPDEDLQKFLREAGGMPENTAPEAMEAAAAVLAASIAPKGPQDVKSGSKAKAKPKKPKADTSGGDQ